MTDQNLAMQPGAIAVLLHDLRGGGAERVMLNLAKGMAAAGRKVTLVLVSAEGAYLDQIPSGIGVVNLAQASVFSAIPAIARYVKANKPSAILSALPHVNVAALLAKRLFRINVRIVLTEHNQITLKASQASGLRRKLTFFLVKMLYRYADAVVAVSNGVAKDIEQYANLRRSSVHCIYNPSFSPSILEAAKERPEHPWFFDSGPDILLAAGRLHKQKAYDVLLRAIALARHHRDVRLLVIGEGEERASLEALRDELRLQNVVDFAGFSNNPYAVMANARLLVMSSSWEGLPTVLIEAMACDLPIVSTDCPSGPDEILAGGTYGYLTPVGDAVALSNAILAALESPKRGGPERAKAFSVEEAVKRYLEVLDH